MNFSVGHERDVVSRRRFMQTAALSVGAVSSLSASAAKPAGRPPVVIFSKHLSHLDYERLAEATAELGFDGVDLTCRSRSRSHVKPEHVERDLPKAVKAIRRAGLDVYMITSSIADPADRYTEPVLRTAADLGIQYYRIGTWKYDYSRGILAQLREWNDKLKKLAELNEKYNICAGYHNHSGHRYIGGPIWDLHEMLQGIDPAWIGSNYDTGHAIVEGGGGAWITNFHLIASRIKMSAVKDFRWEADGGGQRARFCPMGEGIVDWKQAFTMLKGIGFDGPFSYHMEYHTQGGTQQEKHKNLMKDLKRDLGVIRKNMAAAGWS